MGKQRRPRSPRSTSVPIPAPDENPGTATASPPEAALPAAEPAEFAAPVPAVASADETPGPSDAAHPAEVEPIAAAESPPESADAPPASEPEEIAAASESPPEAVEAPPAVEPEAVAAGEVTHADAGEPVAAAPAVDVEPAFAAPAFVAPAVIAHESGPVASVAPSAPAWPTTAAGFAMTFTPERFDLTGIGATITGYMRGESEAATAYMRAMGSARSPADMIRLQVGEFQRAADASLTCWSIVAHKASRAFAYR